MTETIEKKYSKNGMKLLIDSGFKTFDKQTNYIGTGNVIADTQYSNYIRPYTQVKCWGIEDRPLGELCKYDMQHFRGLPNRLRGILLDENRQESYILYQFHITKESGRQEPIFYLITDKDNKLVAEYDVYSYGANQSKRIDAMEYTKKLLGCTEWKRYS